MKKDAQISIRLPSQVLDELKALADADQRKVSDYISVLLVKHVAKARPKAGQK